jgi:hypothetical protein
LNFNLTTTTKSDPAANACVGIYAAHGYNSSASAFAVSPGQELWETEDSDLDRRTPAGATVLPGRRNFTPTLPLRI